MAAQMNRWPMLSRMLGLALLSSLCAGVARGQLTAEVPLKEGVSLNTDFEGKNWAGAGAITGLDKMGTNISVIGLDMTEAARQKTAIWLMRDREYLYLGFECFDDDMAHLSGARDFDEAKWPVGDKVEIYLDGDRAGKNTYYHLIFNVAGSRAQTSDRGQEPLGEWKVVTQVAKDYWRAAVRIPYGELGVTADAPKIRGLFFRDFHPNQKSEGKQEHSSWGGKPLDDPADFGDLIFAGSAKL